MEQIDTRLGQGENRVKDFKLLLGNSVTNCKQGNKKRIKHCNDIGLM